jgi:hypothetical protein
LNGSDKSTLFDDVESKPSKSDEKEAKKVEKEVKKEEAKADAS